MHLSRQQYQTIMRFYESNRQRNLALEMARKEEVSQMIPAIARIDAEIAHRKISSAKFRIFHPEDAKAIEEISDITELQIEKSTLLEQANYPSNYLSPIYTCPLCKDTGYINTEKCTCFLDKIQRLLMEESNLKDFIFRDNFSRFQLDYYSREIPEGKKISPYENMRQILSKTREVIDDFSPYNSQNLLIFGNAGVGKTFLTHCIGAELLTKPVQVLYLTAYQLFEQLADYTFRRDQSDSNLSNTIFDAELLIIDDLGTEVSNAFTNSQLFLCINERKLHNKSTIISTNLSLREISLNYTERVFSRIIDSYKLFQIYGDDIRLKKALTKTTP